MPDRWGCSCFQSFFPSNQGESDLEQIYTLFDKKKRAPNVIPLTARRPAEHSRGNNAAQQSTRPPRQLEISPSMTQQKRMKRANGQEREDLKMVQQTGHLVNANGAVVDEKTSTTAVLQQQAQQQAQQLHHDMQQHLLLQLHQQYHLLQQQMQQAQRQQMQQQPGLLGNAHLLASAVQGRVNGGDLASPAQLQHALIELQRMHGLPPGDHLAQCRAPHSGSMQY